MSDFEREIVHCLNRYFTTHHIQGFAYRIRKSRSTNRCVDVLVDSVSPSFHMAIECRSIIDRKLYFSQHFHAGRDKVHPVDAIAGFLAETKRTGYLAVEFRQGGGRPGEAFLIPWETVVARFCMNRGISVDDARACIVLEKSRDGYVLASLNAKKFDTVPSMDMNS